MATALFFAVFTFYCYWYGTREQRVRLRWEDHLRALAARRGLDSWIGPDGLPRATGAIDRIPVTIDVAYLGTISHHRRLLVDCDFGPDVSIRPAPSDARPGTATAGVVIGHPELDARALLEGDEADLVSRLDAPARAAVMMVLASGGRVEDGTLVFSREGFARDSELFDDRLPILLAAARALRTTESRLERLVRIATTDPVPTVRAHALTVLVDRYPDADETHDAVARGRNDPDGAVRLAASRVTPGRAAARAGLASVVADVSQPDPVRLEAAERLVALRDGVATLAPHTPWLIAALDGPEGAAAAAARLLGAVAGPEAVAPLLAHTRGVFARGPLAAAARAAVDRIQARAGGAAGALSLTSPADGAVSLVEPPPERESAVAASEAQPERAP